MGGPCAMYGASMELILTSATPGSFAFDCSCRDVEEVDILIIDDETRPSAGSKPP